MGVLIGTLTGYVDFTYIKRINHKKSFRLLFLYKTISYISSIVFVCVLAGIIINNYYSDFFREVNLGENVQNIIFYYLVSIFVYSSLIGLFISFLSQASIKFGKGVLLSLITGKYYKPEVENRIFMFLDIKGSTKHAEKLGHIKYSELLQDCIYDLNAEVMHTHAQIFQYVGDGVVLTWKMGSPDENLDCIEFFFRFVKRLNADKKYYTEKYGFVPNYKAGVNGGIVTATEIGNLKREIAYHGDTINTAARIQELCSDMNKQLLVSENMIRLANLSDQFSSESLGEFEFRGKEKIVKVYSVDLMKKTVAEKS
ncbi:MAG: adenylate/guanylate cyclase domain-containing protein [Bacteroidales bacterium]|nr:adenylate/guanylate cyclase domain-containing protein [Bacteroidales bacterium]